MSYRFLFLPVLILVTITGVVRAAAPATQVFVLRKVIVADTGAKVTAIPSSTGGDSRVVVDNVPLFAGPEFPALLQPYFDKPMGLKEVNALAGDIKQFAIKHDRIVSVILPYLTAADIAADVIRLPAEDFAAGVLRVAATVNRYSDFPDFKGNRWFSSKLLREKLGVKPGDEISISGLDEAVNWANTNPFRRVEVFLLPIENRPDASNLVVGVKERIPLRLIGSYDDTGNRTLGNHHYTGVIQYGNFLGLDHQISYQFTTTDHQRVFRAHGLSYQVPLPWRHRVEASFNYLTVNPIFFNGLFNQHGKNVVASVRYTLPLGGGANAAEAYAGLEYKQSNNNLAYGGYNFGGLTDVFQFSAGYSKVFRDKRGAWLVGATINLSPGDFNSRNTDAVFQGNGSAFKFGRTGAKARYAFGSLSFQRALNFERGWQLVSRGTAQWASTNLIGSEQMGIGGSTTVRGFDERILSGDMGFDLSTDLQTPTFQFPLKHLPKYFPPLDTRFLVFYDVGRVGTTHHDPGDVPQRTLASTGFGVRANVGMSVNISADYGWQISRVPPYYTSSRSRGHVKVVLAY